jgi:hypothetical protein
MWRVTCACAMFNGSSGSASSSSAVAAAAFSGYVLWRVWLRAESQPAVLSRCYLQQQQQQQQYVLERATACSDDAR